MEQKQQTLAPVQSDQVDKEELLEEYKLLLQYKNNQIKLQTLISLEQDQETLEELNSMQQELIEAVNQQEEKIKVTQNSDNFFYSTEVIQESMIGLLCKVFYEKDNKWYHAELLAIDTEEQMADIKFVGYKDILKVHSVFIKQMIKPPIEAFQEGTQCECIYSDDGKYYPCEIEQVLGNEKYVVKFKKYNNKETVTLQHFREVKKNKQNLPNNPLNKKRHFDDLSECKIPENMQIQEADTEQQKISKKKKIKAYKQQFKQAVLEKESQDKQNKWQTFKTQKNVKGSIFSTSDIVGSRVGVMNSGKGMTNFGLKDRLQLEDNSHLSRQF